MQEHSAHDTTPCGFTWVKRKLLLGFSCVCVPNDCRLENKKDDCLESSSRWKQNIWNYTHYFTLSTPALRIEFPFLFHLSANMGPLCCPKVLARFPNGQKSDPFVLKRILPNESQRLQIIQHNNDPSSMQSNNTQDWWTYHPLSISWRIHHKIPLPGESHRSVGWRENRPATQLTADAEVFYLIQERGLTIRNLHSSLVRWRLCCWGHLVLLLGYSGAAPAGWSWSYCSHSGSRSVQWSPRSWTEYQWIQMGGGVNRLPQYQHVSFRSNKVVYLQKKEPKRCYDDVWLIRHEWRSVSAQAGTHPEASRSLTGFQAHMKTSDSWPRSTVALLAGISTSTSISMGSLWLSEQREADARVFTYTSVYLQYIRTNSSANQNTHIDPFWMFSS